MAEKESVFLKPFADGVIAPEVERKALIERMKKDKVRFLRLMFTDVLGHNKNVEVPDRQFADALDGQVLFDGSTEPSSTREEGLGEWPGIVDRLRAPVVPHMGWSPVSVGSGSRLFAGIETERFYFVHSYAAQTWSLHPEGAFASVAPIVTWSDHGGPFVAAVENGPLCATQFHPEKSGDAGAHLLENWVRSL